MAEKQTRINSKEGQEIPPLRTQVSKIQMMMYAATTWNPYQLHWDSDFSRKNGFQDANVAGPMFGDYVTEMLNRWVDDSIRLASLEYTNRAMAFPGDTLICRGKVLRKFQEGGNFFLECRVWVENQEGRVLVEGKAILGAT